MLKDLLIATYFSILHIILGWRKNKDFLSIFIFLSLKNKLPYACKVPNLRLLCK